MDYLTRLENWTQKNLIKIQVIAGFLVFLFIIALSQHTYQIPHSEPTRILPELSHSKPLQQLKKKKLGKLAKVYIKPRESSVKLATATTRSRATAPAGWFSDSSQCTYYIWSRRAVGKWNDASAWLWQAKRDGWSTGSVPRSGAIAWKMGHVALVESVSGSIMTISERNYDYQGSTRTITVPISSYTAFIY